MKTERLEEHLVSFDEKDFSNELKHNGFNLLNVDGGIVAFLSTGISGLKSSEIFSDSEILILKKAFNSIVGDVENMEKGVKNKEEFGLK